MMTIFPLQSMVLQEKTPKENVKSYFNKVIVIEKRIYYSMIGERKEIL